jgi:Flagellar hook-length control protein FliK
MSIVINPTIPLVAAQGVTPNVVLQPGTVVSAQVLQVLGNDQVQIAIGGQAIDVISQVPLQAGQTLQLAVSQTAEGNINLAVVNQPAAAAVANVASDAVTLAPALAGGLAAQITVVAPQNQLTPLQALALSVAAETAATQQASLAPLFANLSVAAGAANLPPQVQQAAAQLLAQRTSLDQGLTGDAIKQAFQNSGLFLEASLASGSPPSAPTADLKAALIVLRQVLTTSLNGATAAPATTTATTPAVTASAAAPTLEPTLTTVAPQPGTELLLEVLSQAASPLAAAAATAEVLTTSPALAPPLLAPETSAPAVVLQGAAAEVQQGGLELSGANPIVTAAATPADAAARAAASSAALNLLQEAIQASPLTGPLTSANLSRLSFDDSLMLSLLPAVSGARPPNLDARTSLPPPPISGALPAAQPVMTATLVASSTSEATMHHLLADTDGAIARQTLLQVASLPDHVDAATGRVDPVTPRWNFEIPFATPQGTAMAQFEISRDGGGTEAEAAKRVWRARFSLDVEPAGPVHAQISLSGERTSVRMWAERPATADQLRAGVSQLSQALSRAELLPGDIVIRDGAPAPSAAARAGHFVDRAL